MPLFEYRCASCDKHFERFVSTGAETSCPECGGSDVRRLLSVFAVSTARAGTSAGRGEPGAACGSCGDPRGPGACALD